MEYKPEGFSTSIVIHTAMRSNASVASGPQGVLDTNSMHAWAANNTLGTTAQHINCIMMGGTMTMSPTQIALTPPYCPGWPRHLEIVTARGGRRGTLR